jgi:hypothetical protein
LLAHQDSPQKNRDENDSAKTLAVSLPPDLSTIIEAWPSRSKDVRAAIVSLVQASVQGAKPGA